jgi:hypothetical protein
LPPIELARIIAAASFEMGTAMTRILRNLPDTALH